MGDNGPHSASQTQEESSYATEESVSESGQGAKAFLTLLLFYNKHVSQH